MERFVINDCCLITNSGSELRLTISEAVILGCLAQAHGHCVSRQMIARALWGDARDWKEGWNSTLGALICKLRHRLDSVDAGHIVNQHSVGYHYDNEISIDAWPN